MQHQQKALQDAWTHSAAAECTRECCGIDPPCSPHCLGHCRSLQAEVHECRWRWRQGEERNRICGAARSSQAHAESRSERGHMVREQLWTPGASCSSAGRRAAAHSSPLSCWPRSRPSLLLLASNQQNRDQWYALPEGRKVWGPAGEVWPCRLVAREGAQRRLGGCPEVAKCALQQPQATVNARTGECVSDAGRTCG